MQIKHITPILNVSDIAASFAWFEKLGWKKHWDWGTPPTFGAVVSGKMEMFLCVDGQGSRGVPVASTQHGEGGGVWMSWWVESPAEVDAVHALALKEGITVTWPPTNESWGVRECHIRHPDGHTFRISAGLPEDGPCADKS